MTSRKAGKTNKQARADSKRELLLAGAELLKEKALQGAKEHVNPMGHLKVRAVCDRAQRTSGAFYMHWPAGIEAYQKALGEYLLSDVAGINDDLIDLAGISRQARTLPPLDAITTVAKEDLRLLLASDSWDLVELLTLTWGRDPERLQHAAVVGYRRADQLTQEAYSNVLESCERRPRPPLDDKDVAVMLQAFVEGYGLRCKVDTDFTGTDDPGHLYAIGVAAMLAVLTAGPGDSEEVQDVLARAFDPAVSSKSF